MLDTGPFLLTFTEEEGGNKIREIVKRHEAGKIEVFIHPNNLVEAYKIISLIARDQPKLVKTEVKPRDVIRYSLCDPLGFSRRNDDCQPRGFETEIS